MVKAVRAFAPVCGDAVMNSLRIQGIPFRGPFHTPGGSVLLLLDGQLFLDVELIDLFKQNKLNREGIQDLISNIGASNRGARP